MGRLSVLLLALFVGGASAVALVSCGGGSDAKLLPEPTANQIEANLDEVRQLAANDDCIGAEDAVATVAAEVEELNDVAPKLKTALEEGTAKLSEVVGRCEEEASEEAEPSLESDVEAEELEEEELEAEEKAAKAQEKAEKKEQKEEQAEAPEEEGNLPPQSEGKGKGKGHEEAPPPPAPAPESEESESGGVGPGVGVEE
jgi:uncharacterized protein YqgV (UPF0045/DUF77 family)